MQHYFCDAWNTFDALIVVGSIVDIAITEVTVSSWRLSMNVPALNIHLSFLGFLISPFFTLFPSFSLPFYLKFFFKDCLFSSVFCLCLFLYVLEQF